jgi:hypothetical protein
MFHNEHMTIWDWYLFWILMMIPLVNIYIFFVVLLSSSVNKSLQNYVRALVIPLLLLLIFGTSMGLFGSFFHMFR